MTAIVAIATKAEWSSIHMGGFARGRAMVAVREHPRMAATATMDRLKRAIAAISYAIVLDGPVYAPYLERLEREMEALRASEDVVSRAHKYLDRFRS